MNKVELKIASKYTDKGILDVSFYFVLKYTRAKIMRRRNKKETCVTCVCVCVPACVRA
jgi:hypothetical protein